MTRLLWYLWDTRFGEALRKVEAESLAYRASDAGRRVDYKTAAVLLTTAACLTLQNYASNPDRVAPVVGFAAQALGGPDARLAAEGQLREWSASRIASLTWWAGCAVLCYTVAPVLLIKLGFRERLRDYGTKVKGVLYCWPIYAAFVTVMVPLVWLFSAEPRFQDTYPFFRVNSAGEVGWDLLRWEVLYAMQFVALEFFFRGFVVHGTKHRFGAYALFVMTVPYCMIHFGKPMPEACASIVAGVALGVMSLVTRSVWLGAALHISVAWGMDFACLTRRGMLG